MNTVEQRFLRLLDSTLDISDASALDADIKDFGINSVDGVSFIMAFNNEFGVNVAPADAAKITKFRNLLDYL